MHFDLLICDEGHRLKNTQTQTWKLLTSCIETKRRIVLTGTPLQNDLQELFAIAEFCNPGHLGTSQSFRWAFLYLSQIQGNCHGMRKPLIEKKKSYSISSSYATISPSYWPEVSFWDRKGNLYSNKLLFDVLYGSLYFPTVCSPGMKCHNCILFFRRVYEDPISRSRQPDASPLERDLGEARAAALQKLVAGFTLRRTEEVNEAYLPPKVCDDTWHVISSTKFSKNSFFNFPPLKPKEEVSVFCRPSSFQSHAYRRLLDSRFVVSAIQSDNVASHFACISALKKLCNHPSLILAKKEAQRWDKLTVGFFFRQAGRFGTGMAKWRRTCKKLFFPFPFRPASPTPPRKLSHFPFSPGITKIFFLLWGEWVIITWVIISSRLINKIWIANDELKDCCGAVRCFMFYPWMFRIMARSRLSFCSLSRWYVVAEFWAWNVLIFNLRSETVHSSIIARYLC